MADAQTQTVSRLVDALLDYAQERGLIEAADRVWARNGLLEELKRDTYVPISGSEKGAEVESLEVAQILDALTDDAVTRGVVEQDSVVYRDLFDTALMGRLTPPPREVRRRFRELAEVDPQSATDWYYALSQDTNYIRRDRMAKDVA